MTNILLFSHSLEDKPWWFYFVENLDKPLKDTTWESDTQSEQQVIVMAWCEHEEALIPLIIKKKQQQQPTLTWWPTLILKLLVVFLQSRFSLHLTPTDPFNRWEGWSRFTLCCRRNEKKSALQVLKHRQNTPESCCCGAILVFKVCYWLDRRETDRNHIVL